MSKKPIQITDEMLEDLPFLRAYIARRLWYDYYRNLRIEYRKWEEELLEGNGKPGTILGILNTPGGSNNGIL